MKKIYSEQKDKTKKSSLNKKSASAKAEHEQNVNIKEFDLPNFYDRVREVTEDCGQIIMFGAEIHYKIKALEDASEKIKILKKLPINDVNQEFLSKLTLMKDWMFEAYEDQLSGVCIDNPD
jgi:hypothetical protein